MLRKTAAKMFSMARVAAAASLEGDDAAHSIRRLQILEQL
jgi:hypothetical protein